ncbi:unnamed protein product [Urochloa humidicola]
MEFGSAAARSDSTAALDLVAPRARLAFVSSSCYPGPAGQACWAKQAFRLQANGMQEARSGQKQARGLRDGKLGLDLFSQWSGAASKYILGFASNERLPFPCCAS